VDLAGYLTISVGVNVILLLAYLVTLGNSGDHKVEATKWRERADGFANERDAAMLKEASIKRALAALANIDDGDA
jgi:hypothetical protein